MLQTCVTRMNIHCIFVLRDGTPTIRRDTSGVSTPKLNPRLVSEIETQRAVATVVADFTTMRLHDSNFELRNNTLKPTLLSL